MVLGLKVVALVMAGGKSERLGIKKEKPLLKLLGKPIIDYVIDALSKARSVDRIIVATSSNTPNTKRYLEGKSIEVIETPAEGFVEDMRYVIKKKSLGVTLIVSADLPLITSELIDCIVEKYFKSKKNALVCLTKIEDLKKVIGDVKYEFFEYPKLKGFTPVGINVINGAIIERKSIEEDIFVINDTKKLINVNTIKELDVARRLLKDKLKNNNCYIGDFGVLERMKELEEELGLKLKLVDLNCLKEHEGVEQDRLRKLIKEIQDDGVLKKAIAADASTFVVIDGHHRLNALRLLGCKKIPVCFIDYSSPLVEVSTWTSEMKVTKQIVIEAAMNGSKLPPRTTRHLIKIGKDGVKHITYIEKDVNIPLEKLS